MKVDRQTLYHAAKDFFDHAGNAVMKLSRTAAIELCLDAANQGLLVVKLEGGIWSNGTFEARLDAIWDGADPPVKKQDAYENNCTAANFIRSRHPGYNAFVVTAALSAGSSSATDHAVSAR